MESAWSHRGKLPKAIAEPWVENEWMFADASKEARGPAEQHMFLDRPVKDLGIPAYLAANPGE